MSKKKLKKKCEECNGRGYYITGGADIIADPLDEEQCEYCNGYGYIEYDEEL